MKNNLYWIARKEIFQNFKNDWCWLITIFIFILNIGILYSTEIFNTGDNETNMKSLLLSIIHLHMYIIPLLSLILSYDSILKEKENGMLDLFLSYPIIPSSILFAKWLGLSLIFSFSLFCGGVFPSIFLIFTGIKFMNILLFFFLLLWLNFVFSYIGIIISIYSKDRIRYQ